MENMTVFSFLPDIFISEEPIFRLMYLILVSIAAVFGNLLVLVAVLKFKSLRRATNAILGSLGVADLLVGTVSVPLCIVWTVNPGVFDTSVFMCGFVILSCFLVVTASQINLLILSVEQYLAVCCPLQHRDVLIRHPWLRAIAIAATWIVSLLITACSSLAFNTDIKTCSYYGAFDKNFLFISSILGIFVPFVIIIILNVNVLCVVKEHEKHRSLGCRRLSGNKAAQNSLDNSRSASSLQTSKGEQTLVTLLANRPHVLGNSSRIYSRKRDNNCNENTHCVINNRKFNHLVKALQRFSRDMDARFKNVRAQQDNFAGEAACENQTPLDENKQTFHIDLDSMGFGKPFVSSVSCSSEQNSHCTLPDAERNNKDYDNNVKMASETKADNRIRNVFPDESTKSVSPYVNEGEKLDSLIKTPYKQKRTSDFHKTITCNICYSANDENDDQSIYVDNNSTHVSQTYYTVVENDNDKQDVQHQIVDNEIEAFGKCSTILLMQENNEKDNADTTSVLEMQDKSANLASETLQNSQTARKSGILSVLMIGNARSGCLRLSTNAFSVCLCDKRNDRHTKNTSGPASRRVAKMVSLVCASFILAWFPFFIVIIINTFCSTCKMANFLDAVVMIAFTKSVSNPVIYALCHVAFRRAYNRVLSSACAIRRNVTIRTIEN